MARILDFDKNTNKIIIKFGGPDFAKVLIFVKSIPGVKWSPTMKHWYVERTQKALDLLAQNKFKFIGTAKAEFESPKEVIQQIGIDYSKILLKNVPKEAFPFQITAAQEIIARNNKAILGADPGLGKTLMASIWASNLSYDKPLLVVCPSFLKSHWGRELHRWVGLRSVALEGQTPYKFRWEDVVLINYDILPYWTDRLLASFSSLVGDESHYLANESSARTKSFRRIARNTQALLFLSGTPIRSYPSQFWPQLNMVNSQLFGNKAYYLNRYCGTPEVDFSGKLKYKGGTHLEELHNLVKTVLVRRTREENSKYLPKKNRVIYSLDLVMSREDRDLDSELQAYVDAGLPEDAEFYAKMERLANSSFYYKKEFVIDHIMSLLESIPKLMIVAYHKTVIHELVKHFPGSLLVDGDVPPKKRQEIVDDFNSRDSCVMVAQLEAAGVGFSMQTCRDMAIVEMVWTPGQLTQIEDRILRLTSTGDQVNYYYYTGTDTIEEKMLYTVESKHKKASMILDGKEQSYFKGATYK